MGGRGSNRNTGAGALWTHPPSPPIHLLHHPPPALLPCRPAPALHPEIDLAPDAVPHEEAEDGPPREAVDILERDTKDFRGWRCSYSKMEGEPHKNERFMKYLASQRRMLEANMKPRPEGRRHAANSSNEALGEMHRLAVANAKARCPVRAAYFKGEA